MTPSRAALPLLVSLAASCGQGPIDSLVESEPQGRGTSPLEASFERAASEYQVPVSVLKAIAYVETRVSASPGPSLTGGHGVMHLVKREDWDTLTRAAKLTGAELGRVQLDPHANILGAAAVLRELADKSFAQYADLDPNDPSGFYHAVSLYPGIDSAPMAHAYAADVFTAIERGFEVTREDGTVALSPSLIDWRKHAPAGQRRDALKEYPGAYQWVASPNFSYGRSSYSYVLIHTVQGSYSGCIGWFQNPNSNVSAHYVVRSSDGQVTQMVEHKNTAWHAQCYNGKSIGIEHEGYAQNPSAWYTEAMYQESAKLTRYIADRHGIPKTRSNIIGHYEVPSACNTGGHWDPGSGWNWTKYMSLVNGSTPTPTSGKLMGVIYEGGSTNNRVSGAVVTLNGQSKTTGSDGLYEFVLNPGTYTATVTKSGYGSNSVSRSVTAGTTIWGSMEINPASSTGTLRGKVFVYNAANPTDMSQGIPGATVTTAGKTVTSDGSGFYLFTLSPGTYTVNVTMSGYAPNSVTRAVTSGSTTWGSVGLTANAAPDQQPPVVSITFPGNNSQLDLAAHTVAGTASDDRGPVTKVSLSLNGGAPVEVPVSGGSFSHPLKLSPGQNTLKVSATDAAGNSASDTVTATFNAGISGFVHLVEDEATRLPDITLELLDAGGAKVDSAVTSSDGRFALNVGQVPADYLLIARGNGFITHTETVTIPDDQRLTIALPLTSGSDPNPSNVSLAFNDPQDGAVVSTDAVTVYGTVTGMQLVSIDVNGVAGELLGAGGFSATVPLTVGENSLAAVATGAKGETVSGTLRVVRQAPQAQSPIPQAEASNEDRMVRAGCASMPGLGLSAVLLALPLLRRRR
ncbi:MAG: N-acetylmuramoyl-L-alanine amidase [Myxococcales bacterium]|nr:N-acetylmuramoyl-L-alanine amidase [Myxococcales bacterium]